MQQPDSRPVHFLTRQRGFIHASFDAMFALTLCHAFPAATIVLHGLSGHHDFIRETMLDNPEHDWSRVILRDLGSGAKSSASGELGRLNAMMRAAQSDNPQCIFITDLGPKWIFWLKWRLFICRTKIPVIALVHWEFEGIWSWHSRLRRFLGARFLWPPNPKALRLLVLGDHILRRLKLLLGSRRCRSVIAIEHPGLVSAAARPPSADVSTVRFGFVGVSVKGLELFAPIAEKVLAAPGSAEFLNAGFVDNEQSANICRGFIKDLQTEPLSRESYVRILDRMTYGIWYHDHTRYRFRASGTLIDLMMAGKPAFFMDCIYIRRMFRRHGRMGYVFRDFSELGTQLAAVAQSFPRQEYEEQCRNIAAAAHCYSPEAQGAALRAAALGKT
jgi:hypothetical protein